MPPPGDRSYLPPPIAPAPRLVLFDLDDTLCDYAGARAGRLRIAFSFALASLADRPAVDLDGLIAESIAIHPHGSDHFGDLLSRYGVQDDSVVAEARHWYHSNRFHGLRLFSDALATVNAVRQARPRRRLGLITNGPAEVQRDKIALLGLEGRFDVVLISGEIGIAKPDPAIFAEALRRSDAAPADAVFVGDSPEFDVVGAQAAGIGVIWMNRAHRPWPLPSPPPDYDVGDLASVRRLLAPPDR